jgi:zinc-ribbon domain
MMTCENCGKAIPDNAVVCPNCGAATQASRSMPQQPSYTPPQQGYMPQQPSYTPPQQGYMPQQPGYTPPQQGYMPPPQNQGYGQQQYTPPMYQPGVNVTVVNNPGTGKSNTPVLIEVLLNLFLGVYGVGWLMAGESTTGIVLLICTFVLYWPILIAIAVFTLGLGLFCDVPLWIGVVILNAVLLNSALNRKVIQMTMVQTR